MVILGFVILLLVFFYREIFLNFVIYCCDNFLINIPSKVFLIEELRQGRFPLWNPYIFSGTPFFADINNALLYPLNALYAFFPPFRALTWDIIINFFVALLGTYVFARSLKLSRFGSFISAVVFGFSGTMVVYTNNAPMIQVASLLPWVVWGVGKTLAIAVVLSSIQILAGHPQLTFYTWLFVVAYAFWQHGRLAIKRLFLLGILIFLFTAIQLLPFLNFVRDSTRVAGDYAYATFDSLHPLSVVRLIFPFVVGDLSRGFVVAQGGSVYGYVGVLALVFAFLAKRTDRAVKFFVLTATVSFLLALGKYTPVYWVAYHLIPGIGSFRSPQHFLLLYTFSIAILAGFGIERIAKMRAFLIAVVFLELFTFSRHNLLTVPEKQTEEWMKAAEKTAQLFQTIDRQKEKILVDQNIFPNPQAKGKPFVDIPGETAWQARILRPNLNMLYHLSSIDGYASLILREYQQKVAPSTTDPTGVELKNVTDEMLRKWGVRFFLTKGEDGKLVVWEKKKENN